MAMHYVYINADGEARLALLAERRVCTVEMLIEQAAEETVERYFRGYKDDPAQKAPTDV